MATSAVTQAYENLQAAESQAQNAAPATNYYNPNAGKLLGYIYDNSNSRERWGDYHYEDREGGEGGYQEMVYNHPDKTAYKIYGDSKAIPIYEPPLQFDFNGKKLTDQEKFNLGAALAGVEGVAPKVSAGIIDSNYIPLEMRKAIGLPDSFNMLRNIDPSSPDWGLPKAQIFNPTSRGFFGDLAGDIGPALSVFMMAYGVPPVYAGAIAGANQGIATGGNILKGMAMGAATGAMAQGIGSLGDFASAGLSTATEAAIDAGMLGGASGAAGIAGLLQDFSTATGIPQSVVQNATKGALSSAVRGGDPLEGAFAGVATGSVGGVLSEIPGFTDLDPQLQKMLTSAASGATNAAIRGGDPFDAALQSTVNSFISSGAKAPKTGVPIESSTPTEDWIDKGGLDLGMEYSTPTESWIDSGDFGGAYSTPTEDWFDRAGLVTPSTPPTIEDMLAEPTTPTERYIDAGGLDLGTEYATPTEQWIDTAGLEPSTPFELTITGTGSEAPESTPTEDWIDRGGLGGIESTATEDWIDRGGLGGGESTATEDWIDRGGLGGGAGTTTPPPTTTGGGGKPAPSPAPAPSTTPTTTPTTQAGGPDLLSMLGLLSMAGGRQQQAQAPTIPVVGQITPYQFSTDLLEGIYRPRMASGGSINDLMMILRG